MPMQMVQSLFGPISWFCQAWGSDAVCVFSLPRQQSSGGMAGDLKWSGHAFASLLVVKVLSACSRGRWDKQSVSRGVGQSE
jgi:hypothetical protein